MSRLQVHPAPELDAPPDVADGIVAAIGVKKTFDTGTVRVDALNGVDLRLPRGEVVAREGELPLPVRQPAALRYQ